MCVIAIVFMIKAGTNRKLQPPGIKCLESSVYSEEFRGLTIDRLHLCLGIMDSNFTSYMKKAATARTIGNALSAFGC